MFCLSQDTPLLDVGLELGLQLEVVLTVMTLPSILAGKFVALQQLHVSLLSGEEDSDSA